MAPEYDKLFFPDLCPLIDKQDDRLSFITTKFRDLISKAKVKTTELEFEAKLGVIKFDCPQIPHQMLNWLATKASWDILPPPKLFG
jgi:hypothetical protein